MSGSFHGDEWFPSVGNCVSEGENGLRRQRWGQWKNEAKFERIALICRKVKHRNFLIFLAGENSGDIRFLFILFLGEMMKVPKYVCFSPASESQSIDHRQK